MGSITVRPVRAAISLLMLSPAGLVGPGERTTGAPTDDVRLAFDGDAVLFDAASDEIYKTQGIEAFLAHERANAKVPMAAGPFGQFLRKLAALRPQVMRGEGSSRVRLALVTARNAPAHERVILTFRTPFDKAQFVGHHPERAFVEAVGAHIFFEDQEKCVAPCTRAVMGLSLKYSPASDLRSVRRGCAEFSHLLVPSEGAVRFASRHRRRPPSATSDQKADGH